MPHRFSSAIGVRLRRKLAACLYRSVSVLSPAEWRLDTTGTGLFLLEQQYDGKWWLKGLFFSLADAFDAAERLHGPVSGLAARLADWAGQFESRTERRLIDVDSPWAALVYRNAVERNPFRLDAVREGAARLSPEDVARFVAAQLTEAGRPRDTIEPEAVVDMVRQSSRSPAEINALAGAAVFLADLEGAPRVGRRHVQSALAIRDEQGIVVATAQPRPATAREVRGSNARAAVAVAGLLIVLTSSLAAKWLLHDPATAELNALPASAPIQIAATKLQPAILPAPPAPAAVPAPILAKPADPTVLAAGQRLADRSLASASAPPLAIRPAPKSVGSDAQAIQQASAAPASKADPVLASLSGRETARPERAVDTLGFFEGPVDNETMNRSGRLALAITRDPDSGMIRASFHAGEGLLGSGELAGKITPDGRISASGVLMMGKNPFYCELSGQLIGTRLVGSAQFVRPWGGRIAHSVFRLARS